MTPILKQFGDLVPADFDRSPVWANCHSFDYDEPWYDDTDEETFRPWSGPLPADPSEGMFLVKATFKLADGREFPGFLTPAPPQEGEHLGLIQPYLAAAGRFFGFWGGMSGVPNPEKAAFFAALGGERQRVFPIVFSSTPTLATGVSSGAIAGFYRSPRLGEAIVES
jgi:hypothetical protein